MTSSALSRKSVAVVVVVALAYAALVIMSVACIFDHAIVSGEHQHHGSQGSPTHDPLCA